MFSSNLDNRAFGWDSVNITFRLAERSAIKTRLDTNLHCFIVRNNDRDIEFWDFDEKIKIIEVTGNAQEYIINTTRFNSDIDFGKIIIGYPMDNKIQNQNREISKSKNKKN